MPSSIRSFRSPAPRWKSEGAEILCRKRVLPAGDLMVLVARGPSSKRTATLSRRTQGCAREVPVYVLRTNASRRQTGTGRVPGLLIGDDGSGRRTIFVLRRPARGESPIFVYW